MKKIISIICTLLLSLFVVAFSFLCLFRNTLNKETIMNIIFPSEEKQKEVSYITKETELAYVEIPYDISDLEGIDVNKLQGLSNDKGKIHELLDSTFKDQGLPTEIIDYIIEDNDYKQTVSDYISDYIDYAAGNKSAPVIDQTKVNTILDNNIKKYEQKTGKTVKRDKVEELVEKMSEKIDETASKVTENSSVKKVLNILYSKKLLIGLIVSIVVLLIIIILLNLNSNLLIYLSAVSLIHGIAYIVLKKIINVLGTKELLKSIVDVIKPIISSKINTSIIISLILGILLICIKVVLNKKEITKNVEKSVKKIEE